MALSNRDRMRTIWPFLVSNRYSVTLFFYLCALSWMLLHPLINISSLEAKPRGIFMSENAIAIGTPSKLYSEHDTKFALKLNGEFERETSDNFKRKNVSYTSATNDYDYSLSSSWFERKLKDLGFETEIQTSQVCRRRFQHYFHLDNQFGSKERSGETLGSRHVVVAVLRAISGSSGKESLLITSTLPAPCLGGRDTQGHCLCGMRQHKTTPTGCLPHGSFILIALLDRLKVAKWRSKDILLVLSQPENDMLITQEVSHERSDAENNDSNIIFPHYNPALEAFLRSYHFDALEEQRLRELQSTWDSMNFFSFLQLSLLQPYDKITVKELQELTSNLLKSRSVNVPPILPSRIYSGPIRAAFALDVEGSVRFSPRFASILTQGNGGRLPEMDLYDLTETCLRTSEGLTNIQVSTVPMEWMTPALISNVSSSSRGIDRGILSKIKKAFFDTVDEYIGIEYMERLLGLLTFSKAILMSPVHGLLGSLQSRRLQAIAVKFYNIKGLQPQRGSKHDEYEKISYTASGIGRAIEQWLRALTPLDERLHASSQFYLLMTKDKFLGLTEYIFPFALLTLPAVFLGLTEAPKTSIGAVYGICVCGCCFLFSLFAYIAFANDMILDTFRQLIRGHGCKDGIKVWMIVVFFGEITVTITILPWLTRIFHSTLVHEEDIVKGSSHIQGHTPMIEPAGGSSSSNNSSSSSSSSSSDIRDVIGEEVMEDIAHDKDKELSSGVTSREACLKEGDEIQDISQQSVSSVLWVLVGCVAYPLAYYNFPAVMLIELLLVPMIALFTFLKVGPSFQKRPFPQWVRWALWIITQPAILILWSLWITGEMSPLDGAEELLCVLRESGDVGIGSGGPITMLGIIGMVGVHCALGM